MCKVLSFPAKSEEDILRFIRKESSEGRCVLCGKEVGTQKGSVVVCKDCRKKRNVVRCVRCGRVHTVSKRAWEVHRGVSPYSFLNVDDFGPIGVLVGACRDENCDEDEILESVPFQSLDIVKTPS